MARLLVTLTCLFGGLLGSTSVYADKQEALRLYKEGRKAYDLGRFEEAIRRFSAAYEAKPAAELLFNIAQSHRMLGQCDKALFFYRRYLRVDPSTKIRDEIEGRILELETDCKPPEQPEPPREARPAPPPDAAPPPEPPPTPIIAFHLEAGVGTADIGDLDVPLQPSFRAGVGYPLTLGPATVRLGALGTLLPVPYTGGTAMLSQVLGQLEVSLSLISRLRVRVEAGAGLGLFSGLDAGNPFTDMGAPTTGPLSMFSARGAVGLDVIISGGWSARMTAFSFSYSPSKAGLDASVSRLLRFEGTVGIGADL